MTSQACAKQMIKYGNGGSIVLIASMSGSIANRVRTYPPSYIPTHTKRPHTPTNVRLRASSAPHTTPPKPASYNWAATSLPNGASTTSASTQFRRGIL